MHDQQTAGKGMRVIACMVVNIVQELERSSWCHRSVVECVQKSIQYCVSMQVSRYPP